MRMVSSHDELGAGIAEGQRTVAIQERRVLSADTNSMSDVLTSEPPLYFGSRIPFLDHIGLLDLEMKDDRIWARLPFRADLTNSANQVHGGAVMAALDFAMATVARGSGADRPATTTVDMRASFLRPAGGDLTIEAFCVHRGNSTAFCEGRAIDGQGRTTTTASGTFKLFRKVEQ